MKTINCKFCNKSFRCSKWNLEHRKNNFCSLDCYWKWKKGNTIPWNKGLTKETDERIRKGIENQHKTNTERYGVSAPSKIPGFKEKMVSTRRSRNNYGKGQKAKGRIYKPLSEDMKQRLAKGRKYKNTSIEIKLQTELTKLGIKFISNHYTLCGIPDIFIFEFKLCIFVDGCYWHSCSIHCPNNNIRQKTRDDFVNKTLREQGYSVLRFWEHDVNKYLDKCVTEILCAVHDITKVCNI
jgi:DNA mismatch endonuclease (patch repair protein)